MDLTEWSCGIAGLVRGREIESHQGPIFRTIFSAENHFPWKIPRNFLEKRFFKKFSRGKFNFFSQHFWGKIFRGIFPEIFPG
jgi:hypothetical protein